MTREQQNAFLKNIELQAITNRLAKGDSRRSAEDWVMIVGKHLGDLIGAVMEKDKAKIEKEIFHVAAPLMELYMEVFIEKQVNESEKLVLPKNGDSWDHARKLPGGIEEIRIESAMSGEIKHLVFRYHGKVYKLCDWSGSQPVLVDEEEMK